MNKRDEWQWKQVGGVSAMMAELDSISTFMVRVVAVKVAVLVGLVVVVCLLLVLRRRGVEQKMLKEL